MITLTCWRVALIDGTGMRSTGIVVALSVAVVAALMPYGALCQQRKIPAFALPSAPTVQSENPLRVLSTSFSADLPSALQGVDIPERYGGYEDRPGLSATYRVRSSGISWYKEPTDANNFHRELVKLLRHNVSYRAPANRSFSGRAASAALSTFFTQDLSGKKKLNTSYLLGVLTSAVLHTAYRPYWNRPVSAPFSDFGSTIGNDAGMNLLHELRPGLEQLIKSHTPKFVARLEASVGRK